MSEKSAPPVRTGFKERERTDPPEMEDDAPALAGFFTVLSGQQLASYTTSMLVHMTLLLMLGGRQARARLTAQVFIVQMETIQSRSGTQPLFSGA